MQIYIKASMGRLLVKVIKKGYTGQKQQYICL